MIGAMGPWVFAFALAAAAGAAPDGGACPDAEGRIPVLGAEDSREVAKLLGPLRPGDALPGAPAGWRLASWSLERSEVRLRLEGPAGARAEAALRNVSCPAGDLGNTASFRVVTLESAAGGDEALRALAAHVSARDRGGFFRTFVEPAPAQGRAPPGAGGDDPAAPDPFGLPLHRSSTGLALLLLLAALALVSDLPSLLRDAGLRGPGAGRAVLGLAAVTAAGLAVRLAVEPTFLREAHPLLEIPPRNGLPVLGLPIEPYPQGPQLLFAALRSLLPADPWDAWFASQLVLGTLTIPAAWILGALALGARPGVVSDAAGAGGPATGGFLAAALLAAWPQHVRLSTSESVHLSVALVATLALATSMAAARSGRLTALFAAAGAASATCLMRPEAALWIPPLAVVLLGAGPGVRRTLLAVHRPAAWARLAGLAAFGALLVPVLLDVAATDSASRLSPASSTGEAVGIAAVGRGLVALVRPDGRNAFFDAATTPVWLWPLSLAGAWVAFRHGSRVLAAAALLAVVSFFVLYASMGPAGVVFTMARYHASAFPAVLVLATFGTDALLRRLLPLRSGLRRATAGAGLAAAGLVFWWPALETLPMDWQRELTFALDLGRREPPVVPDGARVVTPDNRRRFLDLAPRDLVLPLTGARFHGGEAVPVSEALARLHADPARPDDPESFFWRGLHCHLAVAPGSGEREDPQCSAMFAAFELTPVETLEITEPCYLEAYVASRPSPPLEIGLYRIGRRKLSPEAALPLLPAPVARAAPGAVFPMAAGANPQTDPADPPL